MLGLPVHNIANCSGDRFTATHLFDVRMKLDASPCAERWREQAQRLVHQREEYADKF